VEKRANEIFVIIDNTEWPEALAYPENTWLHPEPYVEGTAETVFLTVRFSSFFSSTTAHQVSV